MKVLFFTEISPFPINGGERIRSYGLIKALSVLGFKVVAVIQNKDSIDLASYNIKNVEFVTYKVRPSTFISKLFLAEYFFRNRSVCKLLRDLVKKQRPDVAFLDYAFLGQYISFFKRYDISVIYGTHNSQSQLTVQRPYKGIYGYLKKWHRVFFEQLHEYFYFSKADALVVVSEEDRIFHSKFVDLRKVFVIPNFLDEERYLLEGHNDQEGDYYVMTANFNAYMNFEGIKWFLTDVWNKELDTKRKLLLVGKGSESILKRVPEAKIFKNVKCIGPVDNIIPYIKNASAFLIPLLHGSGSRLKCIEAMALRVPIISTPKGVEGIRGNHFSIVASATEFQNHLFHNRSIGQEELEYAYLDFKNYYSVENASLLLSSVFDKIKDKGYSI